MRNLVSATLLVLAVIAPWTARAEQAAEPFHVMLVNDDGVDAPGIAALAAVLAADPAYRLTVIAPKEQQSGKGHALVIRDEIAVVAHEPVAGAPTWSVGATPASVVRLGLSALLVDDLPDLVVSGINKGENVGRIAWYSGTVGGAREAVMAGTPAIAFSLQLDWNDPKPDFETAARLSKPIVDSIRRTGLPEGVYLNVNIPLDPTAVKGYRMCRQGLAVDQLNRYEEVREEDGVRFYASRWYPPVEFRPGTDNMALSEGFVAIVPLCLDATHYPSVPVLHMLGGLVPATE